MAYDWNKYAGGEFVKFEDHGDSVVGVLLHVGDGQDFNGNDCPQLTIETDEGEVRKVTAGQVALQRALASAAPTVGDRIAIVYTSDGEKKPGRTAPKLFDVQVKRAEAGGGDKPSAASLV